jgi:hypothetical protein
MINSSIAKPDPQAAIIVFGRPTGPDLPQASWFKAADAPAVKAAAEQLKFTVIELRTEAEKALAIGVHEGVLKGGGRMIVGSVAPAVYRRIEDYVRKAADAQPAAASKPDADASSDAKASINEKPVSGSPGAAASVGPKPTPASADAKSGGPTAPAAPQGGLVEPLSPTAPWDALRVGGTVLAAYWNEEKEIEGFWPAVITRADKNEIVLKWRDTPEFELGKVDRRHIAILHPEFLALGK